MQDFQKHTQVLQGVLYQEQPLHWGYTSYRHELPFKTYMTIKKKSQNRGRGGKNPNQTKKPKKPQNYKQKKPQKTSHIQNGDMHRLP